jgi:hypothetical protein
MNIVDQNGRKGIVVEKRDHGVFAKPEEAPAYVESGPLTGVEGKAMTHTFWHFEDDGTLRGLWYDSPLNGFVTAHLAEN